MKEVAKEIGATLDDVSACGCELRQLQLTTMLAKCGGVDKAPHVYFDTMAILNKKNQTLSQYGQYGKAKLFNHKKHKLLLPSFVTT